MWQAANYSRKKPATGGAIIPFPTLPEASTGSGQLSIGNVPMVQGIPSISDNSSAPKFAHSAANAVPSAPPSSAASPAELAAPLAPNSHAEPQSYPSVYSDAHHHEHQAPSSHPAHHHVASGGSKIVGHISRRAVLLGLTSAAAVAVAGGGITWLARSRHLIGSNAMPTPIPLGTTLLTYHGQPKGANSIAWSPDGKRIASGFDNVQVWDANTGHTLLTYRGHSSYLRYVAWSHNGTYIASGGGDINNSNSDDSVRVWNATTGETTTIFGSHPNAIMGIAWSPNDPKIASCAFGGPAYVWDANTGDSILISSGHSTSPECIAWSPDGQRTVSGDGEGYIKVWDAITGNTLLTYLGHVSQVNGVAWSPDGKLVASVSGGNEGRNGQPGDSSLQVWDPNTGKALFRAISGSWTVAWSLNGQRVVITSDSVQIRDARSGKLHFSRSSGGSCVAAWSPDGKRIVSMNADNKLQIWQAV